MGNIVREGRVMVAMRRIGAGSTPLAVAWYGEVPANAPLPQWRTRRPPAHLAGRPACGFFGYNRPVWDFRAGYAG